MWISQLATVTTVPPLSTPPPLSHLHAGAPHRQDPAVHSAQSANLPDGPHWAQHHLEPHPVPGELRHRPSQPGDALPGQEPHHQRQVRRLLRPAEAEEALHAQHVAGLRAQRRPRQGSKPHFPRPVLQPLPGSVRLRVPGHERVARTGDVGEPLGQRLGQRFWWPDGRECSQPERLSSDGSPPRGAADARTAHAPCRPEQHRVHMRQLGVGQRVESQSGLDCKDRRSVCWQRDCGHSDFHWQWGEVLFVIGIFTAHWELWADTSRDTRLHSESHSGYNFWITLWI